MAMNDQSRRKFIVFLGSPLIDITTRIDETFLNKYNLEPDNAYTMDETKLTIFDEIKPNSTIDIGGSVTNTVRIFRKLWNFPENIIYLGCIGKDTYGQLIKRQLDREGIASGLMEIEDRNTGRVAVLLKGKARTLVTDLGASQIFLIDDRVWRKINEASHVYFSAFFIIVSFPTISKIVQDSSKIIAMNLGAPFLCRKYTKEIIFLYQNSDLIFGNEAEHREFAKINNINSKDLLECIIKTNQIFNNKKRVIIATHGDKPVLAVINGKWEQFQVEAWDQDRDTNGAGDAFVGGFLASYISGDSVANSVLSGIAAARVTENKSGAFASNYQIMLEKIQGYSRAVINLMACMMQPIIHMQCNFPNTDRLMNNLTRFIIFGSLKRCRYVCSFVMERNVVAIIGFMFIDRRKLFNLYIKLFCITQRCKCNN